MASLEVKRKWQWVGRLSLHGSLRTLCMCMARWESAQDGFKCSCYQFSGIEQICILCGAQNYNNSHKLKQWIKIKMRMSNPELKSNRKPECLAWVLCIPLWQWQSSRTAFCLSFSSSVSGTLWLTSSWYSVNETCDLNIVHTKHSLEHGWCSMNLQSGRLFHIDRGTVLHLAPPPSPLSRTHF